MKIRPFITFAYYKIQPRRNIRKHHFVEEYMSKIKYFQN